jgi:hypothetical protein
LAAACLEIAPSLLDLVSQLVPPVLDEPPAYDLDERHLLLKRQLIDSVHEI